MAYAKAFVAPTKEQALQQAEAFKQTLDMVQQPYLYPPQETGEGQWQVVVTYYGFD